MENQTDQASVFASKKRPAFKPPSFVNHARSHPPKKPSTTPSSLLRATQTTTATGAAHPAPPPHHYFGVLYTKYQPTKKLRKNKNWSDGILEITGTTNKAVLYDQSDGRVVTTIASLRGTTPPNALGTGSQIFMGNWEIEIDEVMSLEHFRSGKAFNGTTSSLPMLPPSMVTTTTTAMVAATKVFRPPLSTKNALVSSNNNIATPTPPPPPSLHDPHVPHAVVLNHAQWKSNSAVIPVVLDPLLAKSMRPHQIEGVVFLFNCIAAGGAHTQQQPQTSGAILADSMGLGKTLTTIALIWTVLRQGGGSGSGSGRVPAGSTMAAIRPLCSKVIVVTPSSLTKNWQAEVRKWLGDERLRTIVIPPGGDIANDAVRTFVHGTVYKVAIISYETLRKHASALQSSHAGLLICDEGHRLKSQGNKTIAALLALKCPRRIILTGTPIQNNLSEFFALADFVCPDVLGSLSSFTRIFSGPIAKAQDKDASAEEKELGESRSEELSRRIEAFVLRRGAEVNTKYLPPLHMYVLFCRPSETQVGMVQQVLKSNAVCGLLSSNQSYATGGGGGVGDQALAVLTSIRKICNHPILHHATTTTTMMADDLPPPSLDPSTSVSDSGKMATLSILLNHVITQSQDRCVVVSQSTSMLDLIASSICTPQNYAVVRIDGSTDVNKRQDIVDAFNHHGVGQVFLLSTTAGGGGAELDRGAAFGVGRQPLEPCQ